MRIIHLTDIHLSKENFDEFDDNLKIALIRDLKSYNVIEKPIDLIVITGDLVDKGGHSLKKLPQYKKHINPYDFFEEYFIDPISKELNIPKSKFLFIPGNHDIDENEILWVDEKKMKMEIDDKEVKNYLIKNENNFNSSNLRIKKFKDFESKFHSSTPNYKPTNNQSTYIYNYQSQFKIGFILINDSWRCSTCLLENKDMNKHYFGAKQLYDGLRELDKSGTNLNICLLHHSLENFEEENEVVRFLTTKNINLFLYGHYHKNKSSHYVNQIGSCYGFRGRASLNNPDENHISYVPGYNIFDIDILTNRIERIHFRLYNKELSTFAPDTLTAPRNGIDSNDKFGGKGYKFPQNEESNNPFSALDIKDFNQLSE
ncbi:metallophosphoesterase [Cellulophaga sp. 20_2_10]|uniref:metallophosphoesterase family protein n=1 Tax=Cellulophaga sp. 20_2_10 TaxID=2942476 RepID=UPI00201AFFA7|nr:metallophosphoesterase [Cellulophaga sp. 20_2_10]MCL5244333.1 metallophosphoesterase [Cellulophaga sp. 20_2_10]